MKIWKKHGNSGFTIIEVTIVLAIAGLIMAIIFIAVPALERNSRNTQRRSDAAHLAGLISEYAANHAGTLPTAYGAGAGQVDIGGEHWAIMNTPATIQAASTFPGDTSTLYVDKGFTCDPTTNAPSAGSSRAFFIAYQVETSSGSQNSCISD